MSLPFTFLFYGLLFWFPPTHPNFEKEALLCHDLCFMLLGKEEGTKCPWNMTSLSLDVLGRDQGEPERMGISGRLC